MDRLRHGGYLNRLLSASFAVIVGVVAISAPIAASIYSSNRQSLDAEMTSVMAIADEAARRTVEISLQVARAFSTLQKRHQRDPCSEQGIALMRELAVSSSYLQAVGYVVDGRLVCSSFGSHGDGLALGAVDYVSSLGVSMRTAVTLPLAPHMQFVVSEQGGYAAIVHRDIPLDIFVNNREVAVGIVNSTTNRVVLKRGVIEPGWLRALPPGGTARFFDGRHVVAIRRSKEFDLTVVAAAPVKYLNVREKERSMILVPVGILAGIALAAALYFFIKQHISLPSILRASLKRDEFYLLYQPLVDLQTGKCIGAEALLRWRRADGELICPDVFIPVAEESGLIQRITDRVLMLIEREVPALVRRYPEFHIGINVAAADLQSTRLVADHQAHRRRGAHIIDFARRQHKADLVRYFGGGHRFVAADASIDVEKAARLGVADHPAIEVDRWLQGSAQHAVLAIEEDAALIGFQNGNR